MNTTQFIKEYSGAAIDCEELAEIARDSLDGTELAKAADEYLTAKDNFFHILEALGYEHG